MTSHRARANIPSVAGGSIGPHQLLRLLDAWSAGRASLHDQLAHHLAALVASGALPAGTRLPSERTMAVALHLSRTTVARAFDDLRGRGVLSSRQGAGTYVSTAGVKHRARGDDRLGSFLSVSRETDTVDLRSAALRGLPLVAEQIDAIRGREMGSLVAGHGYSAAGWPALREAIAAYYCALGVPTDAGQILVTSGAQQATRLVAQSMLERGDTVLIEEPTFRGAIEALRGAGVRLVPVPSGPRGIDVDAARRAVAVHRPALLVLQSTVHNPTGSVLDETGRRAIAGLGVPVLDDATMADTVIDGTTPPPVSAFGDRTITVGSASKAFWGGLRIGWVRADEQLIETMSAVKNGEDLGSSLLSQVVTARLLRRIDDAREQRRTELGHARDVTIELMSQVLPDWCPLTPAGGASIWVRLPGPGATAFTQHAERLGVRLLPGPTFSCVNELDDHLRVSYAGGVEATLLGLHRLGVAWRQRRT